MDESRLLFFFFFTIVAFEGEAAENRPKSRRQRNKEADKRERMYGADIRGAPPSLQRQRDNESASYVFI